MVCCCLSVAFWRWRVIPRCLQVYEYSPSFLVENDPACVLFELKHFDFQIKCTGSLSPSVLVLVLLILSARDGHFWPKCSYREHPLSLPFGGLNKPSCFLPCQVISFLGDSSVHLLPLSLSSYDRGDQNHTCCSRGLTRASFHTYFHISALSALPDITLLVFISFIAPSYQWPSASPIRKIFLLWLESLFTPR